MVSTGDAKLTGAGSPDLNTTTITTMTGQDVHYHHESRPKDIKPWVVGPRTDKETLGGDKETVLKLTIMELKGIEKREAIKLDQGESAPLYLVCVSVKTRKGRTDRQTISFNVDSGSDRSLISRSEARRLGVDEKNFENPKNIMGVGGK